MIRMSRRRKRYPLWFIALVLVFGIIQHLSRLNSTANKPAKDSTPTLLLADEYIKKEAIVTVQHVIDGDTVDVTSAGGHAIRVRLQSIDTPERGEPGYTEATGSLRKLLPEGSAVRLQLDQELKTTDSFGRVLAYVWTSAGCANVEQVRRGHSDYVRRFGRSCIEQQFLDALAMRSQSSSSNQ